MRVLVLERFVLQLMLHEQDALIFPFALKVKNLQQPGCIALHLTYNCSHLHCELGGVCFIKDRKQ